MPFEDYRGLLKRLRQAFPEVVADVRRVKRTEIDGAYCHGFCELDQEKQQFNIRISSELSEEIAVETLMHEWAHALSWHAGGSDHSPAWGKAYARVYRVYAAMMESI